MVLDFSADVTSYEDLEKAIHEAADRHGGSIGRVLIFSHSL